MLYSSVQELRLLEEKINLRIDIYEENSRLRCADGLWDVTFSLTGFRAASGLNYSGPYRLVFTMVTCTI